MEQISIMLEKIKIQIFIFMNNNIKEKFSYYNEKIIYNIFR